VKRAEELPADLRRAKGNPRPEGIVRQFAEEKSATPGQVALACNRSINSRSGMRGFASGYNKPAPLKEYPEPFEADRAR
jgi:hypothetical protein